MTAHTICRRWTNPAAVIPGVKEESYTFRTKREALASYHKHKDIAAVRGQRLSNAQTGKIIEEYGMSVSLAPLSSEQRIFVTEMTDVMTMLENSAALHSRMANQLLSARNRVAHQINIMTGILK